jgi:hypothetical protein
MFCPNCGTKVESKIATFCVNCGQKVITQAPVPEAAQPTPASQPVVTPAPTNQLHPDVPIIPPTKPKSKKGLFIGLGAAVLVLFIVIGAAANSGSTYNSGTDSSNSGETAEPAMTFAEFQTATGFEALTKAQCKPFASIATNTKGNKSAKAKIKAVNKADKDEWSAYSYVNKHDWTADPGSALNAWQAKWDAQLSTTFDEIAVGATSDVSSSKADLMSDFESKVLTDCKLGSKKETTVTVLGDLSTKGAALVSLASAKPWYPRGYSEWEDGLAWKWVDAYSDCYSCRYNHIKVVTRDGCSGGIYAEVNFERGGAVVDWTNDTVTYLGPGKKALLEFDTWESGSLSANLTTLTCNY